MRTRPLAASWFTQSIEKLNFKSFRLMTCVRSHPASTRMFTQHFLLKTPWIASLNLAGRGAKRLVAHSRLPEIHCDSGRRQQVANALSKTLLAFLLTRFLHPSIFQPPYPLRPLFYICCIRLTE